MCVCMYIYTHMYTTTNNTNNTNNTNKLSTTNTTTNNKRNATNNDRIIGVSAVPRSGRARTATSFSSYLNKVVVVCQFVHYCICVISVYLLLSLYNMCCYYYY